VGLFSALKNWDTRWRGGCFRGSEVRRKRATDGAHAAIRFWYAQVKRRQLLPELGCYAVAVRSVHDASSTTLALEGYIGRAAFVQGLRTGAT
jgi:hypothetical protein